MWKFSSCSSFRRVVAVLTVGWRAALHWAVLGNLAGSADVTAACGRVPWAESGGSLQAHLASTSLCALEHRSGRFGACFPFFFFFPSGGCTQAQVVVGLGFCDSPGVYWPGVDFSLAPTFHSLLTQGLADSNRDLGLGRKGVRNRAGQRGRAKDGEE